MTKAVAVYHAKGEREEFMFALSRDGKVYRRDFGRHTRFGTKWNEWRETSFPDIVATGHGEFRRVDKEIKVVLP